LKTFGEPTNTSAELKVQKWFFVFQVVQVFLVTTLSSAAAAVVAQIIKDPTSIPALLAERLPRSSNFYLSYFIVQGTTSAADNFLNYSDLLQWLAYDYLFDKTPRQKYNSYTSLKGLAWGKVFPKYSNFAVIGKASSSFRLFVEAWLIPSSHRLLVHCPHGNGLCSYWPSLILFQLSLYAPLHGPAEA
jgi:calcium permeable stress-gated cation channel